MSLSRSLSPTNTHTNASSCARQEYEHPSYRGDRDTNLHGVTHLFVFPFHLRTLFLSLLIFAIRSHPLSLMLAQSHGYILSILILVWGIMSFHPHVCTCTTVAMYFNALHKRSPRPHSAMCQPGSRVQLAARATATFISLLSLCTDIVLLVKFMGYTGLRYWFTELW